MPELPISRTALLIAINGMTAYMLMPMALRPTRRGHEHLVIALMLGANLAMFALNLALWLGVLR